MLKAQPSSRPRRNQRQSRSSRHGLPLTSTATLFFAGDEHALDIKLVTGAAQQLAAGHVADHGHERVRSRAHQALGLRATFKGIESDILPDGSTDYPGDVLHRLA